MGQLSVTPRLIVAEFERRGYACEAIEDQLPPILLVYTDTHGKHRYISGTLADKSSAVARRIADDKLATATIARSLGLTLPDTVLYQSPEQAMEFLERYGKIVVKPLDSAHGNGVSVNITAEKLQSAIENALQFSDVVLLQQQVSGRDIRLLYIGGAFCAASERKPASVQGDGQRTIQQLIEATNAQPERGENYHTKYNRIPLPVSEAFLGERLHDVPLQGEDVQVVGTANIGSGGTAIDTTDTTAPELIEQGKRLVDEIQAGVCGVDFIVGADASYLIEVNASPSFGLHHYPHEGQPRDVTARFVDWLLG